jgi:hypothetical protein
MRNLKAIIFSLILVLSAGNVELFADKDRNISVGVMMMFGGRFDNVRMCVASPSGAKGGMMADVMFYTRFKVNEKLAISFNLPLMRPILFGAKFKMLQFEPFFSFELNLKATEKMDVVVAPGIGLSFHYGPDYKSPEEEPERHPDFFAMGPIFNTFVGLQFTSGKIDHTIGIRPFITPLFSKEPDYRAGLVAGGAFEYFFFF